MLFLHVFCQIFKNEKFNFNKFLSVMKKILLIAAIAVAAMGCCKKAACCEKAACPEAAAVAE